MKQLKTKHPFVLRCLLGLFLGSIISLQGWTQTPIATRGVTGDLWADKILGQTDFSQDDQNEVTSKTLFHVMSVIVDNLHDVLYVWDSGNNRILGVQNVSHAVNYQGADIVLGQEDFTHSGSNHDSNWQTFNLFQSPNAFFSPPILPTAYTLMGRAYNLQSTEEAASEANMALDAQGNLYVPDLENNRVLRYNYPVYTNEPASYVWGQTDGSGTPHFDYQASNNIGSNVPSSPTSTNLNFFPTNQIEGPNGDLPEYGAGVAIDPWGNLWVADAENNRVLRFPNTVTGVPSTTADVVLGQNSFFANSANGAGNYNNLTSFPILREPQAVRVDVSGNVYVVECSGYAGYGRISIFKPTGLLAGIPTYTLGEVASQKIVETGSTSQGTGEPMGLELDPNLDSVSQVGLWVVDHFNFRIYHYQVNWPSMILATLGTISTPEYGASPGVASNEELYVGNFRGDSVDHYPAGGTAANYYLFHPAGLSGDVGDQPGDIGFREPNGVLVTVSASGVTQIVLADSNRIHYWNMPASGPTGLSNGQPEDGYAATDTPYLFNPNVRNGYGEMAEDPGGNYLWIVDYWSGGTRVDAFNLPLGQPLQVNPVATVSSPLSVLGQTTPITFSTLTGMAMDSVGNLWISDYTTNRVMRVRNPMTTRVVDIVLGQTNAASTGSGLSATTLSDPGFLKFDHHGDLYVSDDWLEFIGNFRMLRFDAKNIPSSPATCVFAIPADGVYGVSPAGSFTTPGNRQYDSAFWEMTFTSDDSFMVAGTNSQVNSGYPPVIIQNPRNGIMPTGTPDVSGAGDNVYGHLNDYGPQSFSMNFDGNNNLYAVDLNRNRVLIYYQPLSIGTLTPTPSPSPSPTPTNQPTSTPTLSPTVTATSTPVSVLTCGTSHDWTVTQPNGVAVDPAGNVYVVDNSTNVIDLFNPSGAPLTPISTLGSGRLTSPVGVAVDGNGKVYVTDQIQSTFTTGTAQYQVEVFNALSSGTPGSWATKWDSVASSTFGLEAPVGIAVNSAGTSIFIADQNTEQIEVFNAVGISLMAPWGGPGDGGNGTFVYPTGVALDASGNVYVADWGSSLVQVFNSKGVWQYQWDATQGTALLTAQAIAVYQNCLVYVTDGFGEVGVFNTQGQPLGSVLSGPGGSFGDTEGVAVDSGGNWYLADLGMDQVDAFAPCPTCIMVPTFTPTWTPTPTPTISPTISPTLAATSTSSGTSTLTTTCTFSPTPTPSSTSTLTFTSTATPTPTFSPTITSTPTITPTPNVTGVVIGPPFPNPVPNPGPVSVQIQAPIGSTVEWSVFTTAFRKILDITKAIPGNNITLTWDLKDQWENHAANGLYYLRVRVSGPVQATQILKVLVLR